MDTDKNIHAKQRVVMNDLQVITPMQVLSQENPR